MPDRVYNSIVNQKRKISAYTPASPEASPWIACPSPARLYHRSPADRDGEAGHFVWTFNISSLPFRSGISGAFSFACPNRSRTFDAPIPTNISTNSDPDIEKKGTFASPATAFASMVFPVPGGPTSRIPLSIEAPISLYFPGSSIRPVLYTQFSSLSVKRIRLF